MSRTAITLLATWIVLLMLLGATVAASLAPLGGLKPAINLAIAFAKAGAILWVFMHLREQPGLARLFATAAAVWLLILVGLTQADLLTR